MPANTPPRGCTIDEAYFYARCLLDPRSRKQGYFGVKTLEEALRHVHPAEAELLSQEGYRYWQPSPKDISSNESGIARRLFDHTKKDKRNHMGGKFLSHNNTISMHASFYGDEPPTIGTAVHEFGHAIHKAVSLLGIKKGKNIKVQGPRLDREVDFIGQETKLTGYAEKNSLEKHAEAYRISRGVPSHHDEPRLDDAEKLRAFGNKQARQAMESFDALPNEIEEFLSTQKERKWRYSAGKKPIEPRAPSVSIMTRIKSLLTHRKKVEFSKEEKVLLKAPPEIRGALLRYVGNNAMKNAFDPKIISILSGLSHSKQKDISRILKSLDPQNDNNNAKKLLKQEFLQQYSMCNERTEAWLGLVLTDTPATMPKGPYLPNVILPDKKKWLLSAETLSVFNKLDAETQGTLLQVTMHENQGKSPKNASPEIMAALLRFNGSDVIEKAFDPKTLSLLSGLSDEKQRHVSVILRSLGTNKDNTNAKRFLEQAFLQQYATCNEKTEAFLGLVLTDTPPDISKGPYIPSVVSPDRKAWLLSAETLCRFDKLDPRKQGALLRETMHEKTEKPKAKELLETFDSLHPMIRPPKREDGTLLEGRRPNGHSTKIRGVTSSAQAFHGARSESEMGR